MVHVHCAAGFFVPGAMKTFATVPALVARVRAKRGGRWRGVLGAVALLLVGAVFLFAVVDFLTQAVKPRGAPGLVDPAGLDRDGCLAIHGECVSSRSVTDSFATAAPQRRSEGFAT